jgi:hypothetical protein
MNISHLSTLLFTLGGALLNNPSLKANSCPTHADIQQALVEKYGTGNLSMTVDGKKYTRSISQNDVILEKLNDSPCIYKMISEGTIIEQSQPPSSSPTTHATCAAPADIKQALANITSDGKAHITIKGVNYIRFYEKSNVTIDKSNDSPCTYRVAVDGLLFG